MAWLLDTNILSEVRRPRPEPKVVDFMARHPLDDLYISELRFGIDRLADPARQSSLSDWLANDVRPVFDQRVLPITEDVMLRWRILVDEGRKAGHTFSQPDLIIAATALCHGLTVVTRDRGDYDRAGAKVLNPWEE